MRVRSIIVCAGSLEEGTEHPATSWRSIRPTRSIDNKCAIILRGLRHTVGRRPPTSRNLAGGRSYIGRLRMPKRIDLTGQRFNHLTVIERAGTDRTKQVLWRCVCDCGNETTATTNALRKSRKKSCGCRQGSFQDHTGERFGSLTALECVGRSKDGNPIWLCRCDCGNMHKVTARNLVHGKVKSCGCLKHEGTRTTHGESSSRLYNVWNGMRQRCSNPNNDEWHNYGGRGITVCDEWQDFETFMEWATDNGYDQNAGYGKCSIDRIDPNGDYEPNNCRWVDYKVQGNNRRGCTAITANGKTQTIAEWARESGISPSTIRSRIRSGWEPSRAVTQRTRQEIYHG